MEMDSDTDSDGSHISATPPASPQQQPQPPAAVCLKKPPPQGPIKPPLKPIPTQNPTPSQPPSKFQICPSSFETRFNSIETLPAGYFSKSIGTFASFSKFQKPSLNFESDSIHSTSVLSKTVSIKHHFPNLIGAVNPLPPVKFRKCTTTDGNGSGNFVKLNLNKNKRKFTKKAYRKKSSYASTRRTYRGSKCKGKNDVCFREEDDGFASEAMRKNESERKREIQEGVEFEEAVKAVKDEASDENLLRLLNLMCGYDSFRDGQIEAIKMVLEGNSTMVVLPTGAGKSLCYQIPAVVLPGVTLVVSPLVSLMMDQLNQLPPVIRGGLLCSNQTQQEASETIELLQEGIIKVLFVSPERLSNTQFLSVFSASTPISLLVVDEAHCISEWSHNFRPSYMRLRASFLRSRLNVRCILAMSATVTTTTMNSVMRALDIPSTNLIQKAKLRENLQLSVSLSQNRIKDLIKLMKMSPFKEVDSIIIYCKFQHETDMISKYLHDYNISAECYHSAIPAKERSRVQKLFCSNKIRVVVATVAFGMGLNKTDVGAVIHYSLPESLEEYIQEIGRAGRDGRLSYCHLFFDDITYYKLRSLMHSDGIDEYAVGKFLCDVFSCNLGSCGKICSLIIESASRKFDTKEEVMLTILTQLELGDVQYIHLLPQLNVTCMLSFYKTSPSLLAKEDIMVSAILEKSETKQGQYVFDIPTLVNSIGITTTDLLNHLQNLKLKGEITYEVKDAAFCYSIVEVPGDLCSLTKHLTLWLSDIERCKIRKLDAMYKAVNAANESDEGEGLYKLQHTQCLQKMISDYFMENEGCDLQSGTSQSSPFLRADIKVFLQRNSDTKFTPRAIARIMHGIGSPAYPSRTWSDSRFWGLYAKIDFQLIMETAKAELMNCVGNGCK